MIYYYIDGDYVPKEAAVLPVSDLAVLRGYAVFTFIRTYNKKPFFADTHLDFLKQSADLTGIAMPWSKAAINAIIAELIEKHKQVTGELSFRIIITGGDSPDGKTPANKPRLLILTDIVRKPDPVYYAEGAKAVTAHAERVIPTAKSTYYLPAILALQGATALNANEILYVDRYGRLLEGSTTNFFAVIDNVLVSAGNHIFPGVTRQITLELAQEVMDVELRDVKKDEIRLFSEAFITSSTKEIYPIVNIDGIDVGDGKVGPCTKRLIALFDGFVAEFIGS